MKTETHTHKLVGIQLLMFISLIAIVSFAFSSCGNNKKVAPVADSVYVQVDEMPIFKGGDAALLSYIATNTKYPEEAKLKNITGKVIVRFVVGKDGSVSQVGIVEGVDPLIDAEAVRVVSTLPKFEKPALVKGVAVSVNYMVPITFRLN
jgi:TonB family protein